MSDILKENKSRENSKVSIIKNFDVYIGNCNVDNLEILGKQLNLYNSQPKLIQKYSEPLKDLIQLLFKYLMDGDKNLQEDIIGCFKDEDIFTGIKNIYYHEDYDINCTIIQSLSILIVNIIKSKAFLYCILSNNFVNDLLLIDYSKYDDEYYSYYVNFIKSLAMRLDQNTFLLFYNKRSNLFPLLECTLNLYNYSNAMIRTVVNNIILQILKCDIDKVYDIFTELPAINYFSYISLRMKDLLNDLCKNVNNLDPYEDLTDLTLFINDLLSLGRQKINFIVRNAIFYYFLMPDIFQFLFTLIYGNESIKGEKKNIHNNKKESIVILCIITFLINIKDETIKYILLQLLLSEIIPEKLDNYILKTPDTNIFYSYKWDKDFQKTIDFTKFITLNYSNEFLASFINRDNYHFRDIERTEKNRLREMKNIFYKCEEINERSKIIEENLDNNIFEMSQFIFDIFNEKADAFGIMKDYHQNLGKAYGVKVGVIKRMFNNPKLMEKKIEKKEKKEKKEKSMNEIDFRTSEILKDCFMCDYKLWMENLNNKNNNNFKFKPNVFKIILFNLLNNENNINVNIPLVIVNNYFIWAIIHKLNLPKIILDHFHLQLSNPSQNQIINQITPETPETPETSKQEGEKEIYKLFIFDEKYLIKNLTKIENNDYKTNNILIEKLCLNLENKILLAKIELIYIELICKNINDLCIDNSPNKEKQIGTLKNTSLNLIKLLINFLQIPDSGFIEPDSSFEEIVCISLGKVSNNLYDDSYYNKQIGNLPKIMEVLSEYESNKNAVKGNLVKSMILSVVYLIKILERFTKKDKNSNSPFKCLFKKVKYNISEILEEKDNDKNRFEVLYEQKSKIIFYDDLFFYYCYLNNGKNSNVEINDIIFIKNSTGIKDKINDNLCFKINNEIIISFNNDEDGEKELKKLEEKYNEVTNIVRNDFITQNEKFNLKKIFTYTEEL